MRPTEETRCRQVRQGLTVSLVPRLTYKGTAIRHVTPPRPVSPSPLPSPPSLIRHALIRHESFHESRQDSVPAARLSPTKTSRTAGLLSSVPEAIIKSFGDPCGGVNKRFAVAAGGCSPAPPPPFVRDRFE